MNDEEALRSDYTESVPPILAILDPIMNDRHQGVFKDFLC